MAGPSALFLDWGGTLALAREHRTVVDGAGHRVLMPNVAATLTVVRPRFERCFIVSNQARIGRGEITQAEVVRRFTCANESLGRPFDGWRVCPHTDADGCECRKPRAGMFRDLADAYGLDLSVSLHVGDSAKDRAAAAAAGVGSFMWARDFFGCDA